MEGLQAGGLLDHSQYRDLILDLIRENLGRVPQAERLIRYMLRFASKERAKPLADRPVDFAAQLKGVGY